MIFIADLISCSTYFGGTIMPIIRSSRVLHKMLLPVVFGALVFKLSVWCGAEGCVSGLWAVAPATCWASNKICNKYHLLHLVGILFSHIHENPYSWSGVVPFGRTDERKSTDLMKPIVVYSNCVNALKNRNPWQVKQNMGSVGGTAIVFVVNFWYINPDNV